MGRLGSGGKAEEWCGCGCDLGAQALVGEQELGDDLFEAVNAVLKSGDLQEVRGLLRDGIDLGASWRRLQVTHGESPGKLHRCDVARLGESCGQHQDVDPTLSAIATVGLHGNNFWLTATLAKEPPSGMREVPVRRLQFQVWSKTR